MNKPRQYALSTCTREATAAGIEIASAGGNAVDVAVAAALDLLVSNIFMCNVAGGGFALVKTPAGDVECIDFFDCMPGKGADIENYRLIAQPKKVMLQCGTDYEVMIGHATVSVPGALRGLELLLKKYGTMPLSELLQPAIKDAKNGTRINKNIHSYISFSAEKVHWPTKYIKDIVATPEGEIPPVDYKVKQPDLANTLELIAQHGPDIVYKGDIAEAIVKEIQDNGGLLNLEDLKTYEPEIRKPLKGHYKGKTVWTNPPPSVGGPTLMGMLNIFSHHHFGKVLTPQDVAIIGKIQRKALHDKYTRYLDPNTNEEVSKELLSEEYARECYKKIQPPPCTTHLSSVDDAGYAVSMTMSMGYGSGVAIPGTGIFMSNCLGEIDLSPRGYLKTNPGDKLTSAMSPSIMYDHSTEDLIIMGGASSSRIPTSLMHLVMNITDFNMTLHDAINAPRCHYEGNEFSIESGLDVDKTMLDEQTQIVIFKTMERFFGGTNCVRHKKGHMFEASNDPRRSGAAQTLLR